MKYLSIWSRLICCTFFILLSIIILQYVTVFYSVLLINLLFQLLRGIIQATDSSTLSSVSTTLCLLEPIAHLCRLYNNDAEVRFDKPHKLHNHVHHCASFVMLFCLYADTRFDSTWHKFFLMLSRTGYRQPSVSKATKMHWDSLLNVSIRFYTNGNLLTMQKLVLICLKYCQLSL